MQRKIIMSLAIFLLLSTVAMGSTDMKYSNGSASASSTKDLRPIVLTNEMLNPGNNISWECNGHKICW